MVELSNNAQKIFNDLYSFQGETVENTFERVAKEFGNDDKEVQEVYDLLANNIWRPNTPVFLNAGTNHKIYSACYAIGLDDSMDSIYDIANVSRKIFQYGSGVGIPIGNLREKESHIFEGEPEKPAEGRSSGPITFMKLYDAVGETTKSGGRVRRAAILCSMPVWHPDILDFIRCKEEDGRLSNMNISVTITDEFMQCLEDGTPFKLRTPYDGSVVREIDPQIIWNEIVKFAHKTADPGVLFIDTINKYNVLKSKILVETTNPCGN
jgi:ribonucleoside-diphosphate reductase alpha chain